MKRQALFDAVKYMWPSTVLSVLSDVSVGFIGVISAGFIGEFTDSVLNGLQVTAGRNILQLALVLGTGILVIPLINFVCNSIMLKQALKHDRIVLKNFMEKDFLAANSFDSGDAIYRLENDPISLRWIVTSIPTSLISAIAISVGLGLAMFKIHIIYSFICVGVALMPIFVTAVTSRLEAKYNDLRKQYNGEHRTLEMDLYNNFIFIRMFSLSNVLLDKMSTLFQKHYSKTIVKSVNTKSISSLINSVLDFSADMILFIFGCYLLSKGEISAGSISAMFSYLVVTKTVISHIKNIIDDVAELPLCLERVSYLYSMQEIKGTDLLEHSSVSIEGYDVSFQYTDNKVALKPIDFNLFPGDKLAIVGPNGSGKSTLIKTLLTLHEPYGGNISVNGVELNKLIKTKWRDKISYIEQDPFIFKGTVEDNIRLGNLQATEADILKIIRFMNLENLEGELIESGGNNLSGGERQKISIARALIKDVNFYFLDEPYNNLDSHGRKAIERLLSSKDKTIVYITHDKSLLQYSNKVLDLGT